MNSAHAFWNLCPPSCILNETDPLMTLIRLGHSNEVLQLASRCGAAVKVGHGSLNAV